MGIQTDMFGYHERDPKLGQLFTPPWLARRAAGLLTPGARVLEPGCGSGNLIEAAVARGHHVVGIDVDPRWVEYARNRFSDLSVYNDGFGGKIPILTADFLRQKDFVRRMVREYKLTESLTNPDYTDNTHLEYADFLLELFEAFVGIFPITFEHTQDRDKFWANVGRVTHRARMPERVKFGETSGQIEVECIRVARRYAPRTDGEWIQVQETTWRP